MCAQPHSGCTYTHPYCLGCASVLWSQTKQVSRGEHDGTVIYKDAHGRAAGFEPVPVFSCPGVVEHLATTDDHLAGWHRVLVGRRDLRALATQALGLARVDLGL